MAGARFESGQFDCPRTGPGRPPSARDPTPVSAARARALAGMMSMASPVIMMPGTKRLSFTRYIASEFGFDGGDVRSA